MNERRIEVLVFDGCPNLDASVERARAALAATAASASVTVLRVGSDEEAARLRFLGSPTVRVDGVDVDPSATERHDYGMQCRLYAVDGRLEGAPPTEWIVAVLRGEALQSPARPSMASGSCCAGEKPCP